MQTLLLMLLMPDRDTPMGLRNALLFQPQASEAPTGPAKVFAVS